MQRRPEGVAHAGLWEFPGGKIEPGESPRQAAVRELAEELGIAVDPDDLDEAGFASAGRAEGQGPVILLLFACRRWRGTPRALAADELGWFAVPDLASLAMPTLDYPLAAQLERVLAGNCD